jgi:hypothetical protein
MASSDTNSSEAIGAVSASQFHAENTVTLLVGADEEQMIAYGDYLAQDSEFFAAALKKEWAEGQTRIIKLPEESSDIMAYYLSFVYRGKVFAEDITTVERDQIRPCYALLASFYVCGERYLNRRLQFAIIKQILRLATITDSDGTCWYPNRHAVKIVYSGTPEGSPGRRFLVDVYVLNGHRIRMNHDFEVEFLVDLAKALYDKTEGLTFREQDLTAENYMHTPYVLMVRGSAGDHFGKLSSH